VGSRGIAIYGSGSADKQDCATLTCDTKNGTWSCGDPRGKQNGYWFGIGGRGSFSIPLDHLPLFKPVCAGQFANVGVSCNVDVDLSASVSNGNRVRSGAHGQCGSGCEDGRETYSEDLDVGLELGLSLEIEVALGKIGGNLRAGLNAQGAYTYATRSNLACTGAVEQSTSHCFISYGRFYARGCIGNGPFSYCIDYEKELYKFHAGTCPDLLPKNEPGDSPGTLAGNACASNTELWNVLSRRDQCYSCCNQQPFPPFDLQSGAGFDHDCKAVCDAVH
jgi:hypothetical protein